jgi:hypothetical protein
LTREQARKNLETIGIENPTDEQITNYLNQVQGETRFERERADKLKDKASKADELQQQIDEMQSANQTDNEKLQTALDKANGQIASLQKDIARTKLLNNLASKGITGDDAEKLVSEDGTLDIEILGKIISDRETSAAANKEKELLNGTPNPNGGKGGSDDGKTSAEKMVEKLFPKQEQGNNSIENQYINNEGN